MKCRRARQLLSAKTPSRELRSHLADCAECSSFRQRLDAVMGALEGHHLAVVPPADFATRIRRSLHRDDDPLAWAALRLLPATLGLVLLLSWLNLRTSEPAAEDLTDPTAVVLSWVLDPEIDEASGTQPISGGNG